ncbi:MAG: dockerin type I repeat-containing protein [Clostridia bacterium]|nr:dockerin type I repeat-containing protein [Clostridia bacterium]
MKVKGIISIFTAVCMIAAVLPVMTFADENNKITYYYGDANVDGIVNTADATWILKYCAGQIVDFYDDLHKELADADRNGEINTADATYVLRGCLGLVEFMPYHTAEHRYYNVNFHSGNVESDAGLYVPSPTKCRAGTDYVVKEEAKHDEHVFSAWQADFNEQKYKLDESFVMPEQDIVLTAVWDENIEIPTETPTETPTEIPTETPTEIPTEIPTEEPTETPTEEPTEIPIINDITVTYCDDFNEREVTEGVEHFDLQEGENTLTAEDFNIPQGYKLCNPDLNVTVTVTEGIPSPDAVLVDVYPVDIIDGAEYTVIYTVSGFEKVNLDMDGNYILGNDIDLGDENRYPFGWAEQGSGEADVPFTGIFDGNEHSVTGLYIDHTNDYDGFMEYTYYENVGLFAINDGVIRNLCIYTKLYEENDPTYGVFGDVSVGAVAGSNSGLILNCHVYGNVGSMDFVEFQRGAAGGITGTNTGTVRECSMEGGVEGFYFIGGLVGKNTGLLTESYFAGGINSQVPDDILEDYAVSRIGGLCGGSQNGEVSDCYVLLTNCIAGDQGVGGLIGWISYGTLTNLYVANTEGNIRFVTADGAAIVGYVYNAPTYSGLYADETYTINGGELPNEFDEGTWDMNGACHAQAPDLIKNRRGATLAAD